MAKPRMTDVVLPPTFETTASFTPGPWKPEHEELRSMIFDSKKRRIADVHQSTMRGINLSEREANASLIAAAPNLLAALEYAHNHIMNPDNTDLPDLYRTIRAAIAAAKAGA